MATSGATAPFEFFRCPDDSMIFPFGAGLGERQACLMIHNYSAVKAED
jgi:hypothetical protein